MSSSSYNRVRNYDEIVKTLTEDLNYHKFYLELLEKIEIKRKKDGTHYQNKNQTFVNANYTGNIDNTIKYPELRLIGRDESGNWREYSINCYLFADELPKDDDRRNKALTGSYTRDCYNLTTDEIIEKIESEKEKQKAFIKNYENQIENSKQIFDEVVEKLDLLKLAIVRNCKQLRDDKYTCSLEYALFDYVRTNIN